jgi:outer membrane phospholipase A
MSGKIVLHTGWHFILIFLLGGGLVPCAVFSEEGAESESVVAESGTHSTNSYNTLDSFYTLYQPYIQDISPYQPVYFLIGSNLSDSKFQISFKYRILNSDGYLVRRYPWLSGIYFGYTQTSFWDLESDSLPFEDTSYKPEFFHLSNNLLASSSSDKRGLFLKSGLFHESNGKSDEDSRGINTVYVQPLLVLYSTKSGYGLGIGPKVWGYISTSENNQNIADYRGYFDVDVKIGKKDGMVLTTLFGWAKEGGSVQVDLSYPVGESLFNNINLYLHVEYINALAENLLYYEDRTEAFRIGISFVR